MSYEKKQTLTPSADIWVIKNFNQLSLTSKAICEDVLQKYLPNKKISVLYTKYGKPYLRYSNLYFSIAHTDNILIIAISRGYKLGVDIEKNCRNIVNPLQIANKFFYKEEVEDLIYSDDLPASFIKLWVIKEAFIKMKGLGMSYGLNKFWVNKKEKIITDFKSNKVFNFSLLEICEHYLCCIVPKFSKIRVIISEFTVL